MKNLTKSKTAISSKFAALRYVGKAIRLNNAKINKILRYTKYPLVEREYSRLSLYNHTCKKLIFQFTIAIEDNNVNMLENSTRNSALLKFKLLRIYALGIIISSKTISNKNKILDLVIKKTSFNKFLILCI
ncbi:hypothetical protein C5Q98_06415 [Fastidiosipila sanguinis]|uniref:Uncharacterized protein n=1 Tax=Fastidiosipila sanguinis TaxID=236753 RepID=A0A2S0KPC7_9FIRM|nr:hypothetical protein C5Q98_06415 [Fastidiosipila sanguinis]